MATLRLFTAVEISATARGAIAAWLPQLGRAARGLRPVAPETLHLTLSFLGPTDEELVPEIGAALAEAVAESAPFVFTLAGVCAFPNLRSPRVVWLGVRQGEEALVALQQRQARALQRLGFPPEERPYAPHLTLARAREGRPPRGLEVLPVAVRDFVAGASTAAEVVLCASELRPGGPIHTPLRRAPLGG